MTSDKFMTQEQLDSNATNHAKARVQTVYPDAGSVRNRRQRTFQVYIIRGPDDERLVLGVGATALLAWKDAASTIERSSTSGVSKHQPGSPTWSLKSDEPYWKGKRHEQKER